MSIIKRNEEYRMTNTSELYKDRLSELCEEYRQNNGFNKEDYQTYGEGVRRFNEHFEYTRLYAEAFRPVEGLWPN